MAAEEVGVALNLPPTTDGMTMARLKTASQATATQGVAEAATPRTVIEATAVVSWRQSYKRNIDLKKTNLVLNSLMVRFLNSDCNNTVV